MSYPVIGFPNWNKEFFIEIDGSKVAVGATLLQAGNYGQLHPLSYFLQPWMIRRRIIRQQNWNVGQQ